MKKYETPIIDTKLLEVTDVILASDTNYGCWTDELGWEVE